MIVAAQEFMPVIRAALERGQTVRMTVTGSSMLPFIHNGDVVDLHPVSSLPKRGDVVLAKCRQGRYVLHRVIRLEGNMFFLRGDAQRHLEESLTARDVLGRIDISYHHGRPRVLCSGVWHLVWLLWTHSAPFGPLLLQFAIRIRRIGR